jgi:Lar family restriction alleviation protein
MGHKKFENNISVAPIIGGCDICGKENVEVVDSGQTGYQICGFSVCKPCCKKTNHSWPASKNAKRDRKVAKLLPCPFCGGNASLFPTILLRSPRGWAVSCDKCDALGHRNSSKEKAVWAWNNRQAATTSETDPEEAVLTLDKTSLMVTKYSFARFFRHGATSCLRGRAIKEGAKHSKAGWQYACRKLKPLLDRATEEYIVKLGFKPFCQLEAMRTKGGEK